MKMKSHRNIALVTAAIAGLATGTATRLQAGNTAAPSNGSSSVRSAAFATAGDTTLAKDKKVEKHACKGQNSCKGKGGCKTGDNACKAKNSCKGKGGCATDGSKKPA
jgi:hypothetical protein